jgi:hypothetical protein
MHVGAQVESACRQRASLVRYFFKLMLIYGKEEPGESHPVINEWGRVWVFWARCWWSGPSLGNLHTSRELSLLLACLIMTRTNTPSFFLFF